MKEMREEIRRIEEPTVADMVMKYYDHRNEVALAFDHGIHAAQKTNLKQMNKDCNYLMSNSITTPDELEEVIQKKKDALSEKEGVIKEKRGKVKEYQDRLKSLDNYEKYKPVFEESQKLFFKAKRSEYQKAHRRELNQYHKAERELDPYLVDGSMDAARELWNEKIDALEDEITEVLEDKDLQALKDEIGILKDIKKDEKRQREREKALKLLIGGLFVKHLPDYMLYEDAEMERIVVAAMESEDCRNMIETIRAEAEGKTETTEPQTLKGQQKATEIAESEDTENDNESDEDGLASEEGFGEDEVNEEPKEDEESYD